jgi:hypothetical protein
MQIRQNIMKRTLGIFIIALVALNVSAFGQQRTVVKDANAKRMLLGRHLVSLQWISWDYFGRANVTERKGVLYLKGEQKGRGESSADYLKIDGVITRVDAKEFKFDGKITVRVSHINSNAPCERTGEMTFRVTGKRKYWRLMEMDNPCEGVTDYVDIYFR